MAKIVAVSRLQRMLAALGYDLTARWRLPNRPIAEHLRELFARLDTNCVIDVGANEGQYRKFLRQEVGYEGLIVSIEPVSQLAAELRRKSIDDPKWIVRQHALGQTKSVARLNVMRSSVLSSFLPPDSTHVPELSTDNVVSRVEEVEVLRLDGVIAELRESYDISSLYLKIDTQGFDLEVIKGAGAAVGEIAALQTEMSLRPIYSGMPDFADSLEVMQQLNFHVSGFFPVTTDRLMRLVEVDCVMIAEWARFTRPQSDS